MIFFTKGVLVYSVRNSPRITDPDLWIHPDDSKILTLNAGEIVVSDIFSVGLALRFPRITKIREGADEKPPSAIESDLSLWKIFKEVTDSRSLVGSGESVNITSPNIENSGRSCRFLTEDQLREVKSKPRKTSAAKESIGVNVPKMTKHESILLSGLTFHVFEGNRLCPKTRIYEFDAKTSFEGIFADYFLGDGSAFAGGDSIVLVLKQAKFSKCLWS